MRKVLAGLMAAVMTLVSSSVASAQTETYNDYSKMFDRSAGQYKSYPTEPPYQWAWGPTSATETQIRFDTAANWAAGAATASTERFSHQPGDAYVEQDGWGTYAHYYKLNVVTMQIGDQNCQNYSSLPGGTEKYVKWDVSPASYCLDASGYVQRIDAGVPMCNVVGKPVCMLYQHKTVWSYRAGCTTPYMGGSVSCLDQHEQWYDNNGRPWGLYLDRTISIAKGKGMAYRITGNWDAGMNAYWSY